MSKIIGGKQEHMPCPVCNYTPSKNLKYCPQCNWELQHYINVSNSDQGALKQAQLRWKKSHEPLKYIKHPEKKEQYPLIDDWSTEEIKHWQAYTAKKAGMSVFFRDKLKNDGFTPEMAIIPGGEYTTRASEENYSSENQQSLIIKPISMGRYPVTFAEYDIFCNMTGKRKPKARWGREQQPVINVNWFDAIAYTDWLSEQSGYSYRLPTEAEWEYVCRAGTITTFYFGQKINADQANYDCKNNKQKKQTTKVGSYPSNALGLYDLHGNVWEWTCSRYDINYDNHENICLKDNIDNSTLIVSKGGSWSSASNALHSSFRNWGHNKGRYIEVGFRLAREH